MNRQKILAKVVFSLLPLSLLWSCRQSYSYESVEGDPLKAKIYTLDNGLKIYMTVNKEKPRIQTYMAMHVGSKNDPSQTTGLAHYFEHLMFKGTEQFGTTDYETEKPYLDEIERLFEVYRQTVDQNERKVIYRQIDSVSLEASKIFIPNEYDKLMAAIGASGTNAWTSYDETVYTEDIPSNEIERWALIQSDRFKHNVIRGFHTELETVYEEMNMYSAYDDDKMTNAVMAMLFPSHPYGDHSVIGKQEHLKNPSITNIKQYYADYYVPNNMAVCLSGDFDPDYAVSVIEKYFSDWQPNPDLPVADTRAGLPANLPQETTVWGQEAEYVTLAWRGPHILSGEDALLEVTTRLLYNGKAGIIDTDLIQNQKVLGAAASSLELADGTGFYMIGYPKDGQTLDDVKGLLLASLEKLAAGEFDEKLITAIVNNYKLSKMRQLESNSSRARLFVSAFINNMPWEYSVRTADRMEAVTKEAVMEFVKRYFDPQKYALVYKRQGEDPDLKKIEKPQISPINTNRDSQSDFLKSILAKEVKPIEPVFYDLKHDVLTKQVKPGVELVYVPNTTNDIYYLTLSYNRGDKDDNLLSTAFDYLSYLGTSDMSARELKEEFYNMACSYGFGAGDTRTSVVLSGLSSNMKRSLELMGKLLRDPQPNSAVYGMLVEDILKARIDDKTDQNANQSRLTEYMIYGPVNGYTNIPSAAELQGADPTELLSKVKELAGCGFKAYYYGPLPMDKVAALLAESYAPEDNLKELKESEPYKKRVTEENLIFLAQYDAPQMLYSTISVREGETFDKVPYSKGVLYNEYFGGGMNGVVFQEMREARGLAYTARARFSTPEREGDSYSYTSYIGTQTDKQEDAMSAFHSIINDMPQSEQAFSLAKEGLTASLRTQRVTGQQLLSRYQSAERTGIWQDLRKDLFKEIPSMTLQDLVSFQQEWIKGRPTYYSILSDMKSLDLKRLSEYGKIEKVSQESIFGY